MARIVVVGSINMDLVTRAPRFPTPGETLLGERFDTVPGGKGANQAVAAARLGAQVALVGALGEDAFGEQLRDGLADEGIDLSALVWVPECGSGCAAITVAGSENQIVVVPGANARLSPQHVAAAEALIANADALLLQLEIPLPTVEAALRLAQQHGVPAILNPAPAQPLPREWLTLAHCVTPNQHELAILLGETGAADDASLRACMREAPCPVVMTRGAGGAWYADGEDVREQAGFPVDAVDSTGAGDTFNAALAVFLHEGLASAVRKACATAALSVTRFGAQGGMPSRAALKDFLAAHPG